MRFRRGLGDFFVGPLAVIRGRLLEAVVLAGLVVKEIGTDILAIKALTANEQRIKYMRDVIMTKVKRYLRPPEGNDKWWKTLRASGGKEMEMFTMEYERVK